MLVAACQDALVFFNHALLQGTMLEYPLQRYRTLLPALGPHPIAGSSKLRLSSGGNP